MIFLNQLMQGVFLGGYYALIACSLSFMFGVMRIVNLAHGSLVVLAAFLLFVLAEQARHVAVGSALIVVMPAMAVARLAAATAGAATAACAADCWCRC